MLRFFLLIKFVKKPKEVQMKLFNLQFSKRVRTLVEEIFLRLRAVIADNHFVYAKKPDGWYHGSDYVNKDAVFPHTAMVSKLCAFVKDVLVKANVCVEVVVGPTVGGALISQWLAYHLSVEGGDVMSVFADEEEVLEKVVLTLVNGIPVNNDIENLGVEFEQVAGRNILNLSEVRGKVELQYRPDGSSVITFFRKVETRRIIKRGYPELVNGKEVVVCEDVINSGATVVKTIKAVEAAGGRVVGVVCFCNRSGGKVTAETLGVTFLLSMMDVSMPMYKEAVCPICAEKGVGSVNLSLGKGKEFLGRIGENDLIDK